MKSFSLYYAITVQQYQNVQLSWYLYVNKYFMKQIVFFFFNGKKLNL